MNDDFLIETPEAVSFGYDVAGIGSRFMAALVDTLLIGIIQAVVLGVTIAVLSSAQFGPWIAAGGYLAPYRDVDPSDYPDRFDASVARRLGEADVVRFDLSDSWPPGFGSGIVWDVLTRFTAGAISLDDALAELEAGRQEALVETAARS